MKSIRQRRRESAIVVGLAVLGLTFCVWAVLTAPPIVGTIFAIVSVIHLASICRDGERLLHMLPPRWWWSRRRLRWHIQMRIRSHYCSANAWFQLGVIESSAFAIHANLFRKATDAHGRHYRAARRYQDLLERI